MRLRSQESPMRNVRQTYLHSGDVRYCMAFLILIRSGIACATAWTYAAHAIDSASTSINAMSSSAELSKRHFGPASVVTQPRVWVAIPAKDEADELEGCLTALAAQRHPEIHGVVICLCNCTDDSSAI